jgi:hypothetical protein
MKQEGPHVMVSAAPQQTSGPEPDRRPDDPGRLDPLSTGLDSLSQQVAVGRGLALALGALAERASFAERETRAASWETPESISDRVNRAKERDVQTARSLAEFDEGGGAVPAGAHVDPRDLNPEATAATIEAASVVRAAFAAVSKAHEAVLAAQLASARQQVAKGAETGRPVVRLPQTFTRHGGAVMAAIRAEIRNMLNRKPRKFLRALLIAVLSGALYLAYIRIFAWQTYGRWAPYLAVLFISSVMGTSVCFNSFGFDAARVRVAMDKGARLWQILIVKNIALMILVFPLGLVLCLVLAFLTGKPATLLASIGLVLCILTLWSGVGNLLSVVLPIRDAPLKVHRKEGTLKQFAVEFAITWGVSYVVLFLLIWRIYSAKGMGERYGSTFLAVLFLVLSGIVAWINMTVIAVAFTNQPGVYRRLRRELDWVPTDAVVPPTAPSGSAFSGPSAGASPAAPEAASAATTAPGGTSSL